MISRSLSLPPSPASPLDLRSSSFALTMSFVLPPASHLTASPLGVQRRVARAQALSDDAAYGQTSMHASSRAQPPQPIPAAAASSSHLGAAPRAAVPAPRPSMGLFAHHPAAAVGARSDASLLLSEDRPPPLSVVNAAPSELAKIYSFMDEAQGRTRDIESKIEIQKEANRVLLISSSEALIAFQTEMDQIAFENACMASELAALTADNKAMLSRAKGEIGESTDVLTTPATPAVRHASIGSSRDSVSSASHYTNSPRFEGLTIASRPPSQQKHR